MSDLFNNREIATGMWLAVAIFLGARNAGIRESCGHLFGSFWKIKIVIPVLLMALHVGLSVLLLHRFHLWNMSLLKNTIYWFLFSGFVLFMNLMTSNECVAFFKKTIVGCVKIIVVIEFLLNFYTLPLLAELALVPAATFLVASSVYAENKPEYAPAKKLFDFILAVIGFALAGFVAKSIYQHYSGLMENDVLLSILLPINLTILLLPFLYFAKLIADYETLFIRLTFFVKEDDELFAYIKKRVVLFCHINLRKLNRLPIENLAGPSPAGTTQDVDMWLKNLRLGGLCDAEE